MNRRRGNLVVDHARNSAYAEAYRMLRTNLLLRNDGSELQSIVVTSGDRGEGKSVTSANLALLMSRDDRDAVLVDADLRLPSQHEQFGIPLGTHDFQAERLDALTTPKQVRAFAEGVGTRVADGLLVVPAGAPDPNPSETVGNAAYRSFIEGLAASFDIVIVDTPPLGVVTDAAIVSGYVDGALLVVDYHRPKRAQSIRAVHSLQRVNAPILGAVLNRHDGESTMTYGETYGSI